MEKTRIKNSTFVNRVKRVCGWWKQKTVQMEWTFESALRSGVVKFVCLTLQSIRGREIDKLGGTADSTSFVPLRLTYWTHDVFYL